MSAQPSPTEQQLTPDEERELLENAYWLGEIGHTTRRFVAPVYWAALLFSGIGLLFELAILIRVLRQPISRGIRRILRWLSPIDTQAYLDGQPAGITSSAAWQSDTTQRPLKWKIGKQLYDLLVGPFDSLVYHSTHAIDPYPSKMGSVYRPFNTFPEFTLQGLITLAAAAALFQDYSPGLLMTDQTISLYCAAGLVRQFITPVLESKRIIHTFPSATLNLKLATLIAVLGYVGALILAKLAFAPLGSIQWTADGVVDWLTRMAQELWPKSLAELRAMVAATGLPYVWPGLIALLPLLPAALSFLFSLGAIKLATSAIFLKPDDDSYYIRGMHFLEAGQTQPAATAFEQIQDLKRRNSLLLIPPLVAGDKPTFDARFQAHAAAQFGPFATLQPAIALSETMLMLDRVYNLDLHRYPLVSDCVLYGIHPALAAQLFLPIPDRLPKLAEMIGFQKQTAAVAEIDNPTRFPAALFSADPDGAQQTLVVEHLLAHLAHPVDQGLPPLDQFGCLSYAMALAACHDAADYLAPEDLQALRDAALDCARRLYDIDLPLGSEFEEYVIKVTLWAKRDMFGLADRPDYDGRVIRDLLDEFLIRNIQRADGSAQPGQPIV